MGTGYAGEWIANVSYTIGVLLLINRYDSSSPETSRFFYDQLVECKGTSFPANRHGTQSPYITSTAVARWSPRMRQHSEKLISPLAIFPPLIVKCATACT